eukprot:219276-Rhodomonas_salina.1
MNCFLASPLRQRRLKIHEPRRSIPRTLGSKGGTQIPRQSFEAAGKWRCRPSPVRGRHKALANWPTPRSEH